MDTLKTRIQATVGAGPGMKAFLKTIPQIGARNLYRGIIPAVVGAASGHGFRTATYEVACKLLAPLTLMPLITEIQIQGFGSGLGTLVGTSVRIPCEVLKQRLQTGQHANAVEAFKAVTANGPKGLFAGTAATLARGGSLLRIGLVAYEKLKKAAATMKRKDLSAWETISLGGMAGCHRCGVYDAGGRAEDAGDDWGVSRGRGHLDHSEEDRHLGRRRGADEGLRPAYAMDRTARRHELRGVRAREECDASRRRGPIGEKGTGEGNQTRT